MGDLVDLTGMSAGPDPVTEEWSQTPVLTLMILKVKPALRQSRQ